MTVVKIDSVNPEFEEPRMTDMRRFLAAYAQASELQPPVDPDRHAELLNTLFTTVQSAYQAVTHRYNEISTNHIKANTKPKNVEWHLPSYEADTEFTPTNLFDAAEDIAAIWIDLQVYGIHPSASLRDRSLVMADLVNDMVSALVLRNFHAHIEVMYAIDVANAKKAQQLQEEIEAIERSHPAHPDNNRFSWFGDSVTWDITKQFIKSRKWPDGLFWFDLFFSYGFGLLLIALGAAAASYHQYVVEPREELTRAMIQHYDDKLYNEAVNFTNHVLDAAAIECEAVFPEQEKVREWCVNDMVGQFRQTDAGALIWNKAASRGPVPMYTVEQKSDPEIGYRYLDIHALLLVISETDQAANLAELFEIWQTATTTEGIE